MVVVVLVVVLVGLSGCGNSVVMLVVVHPCLSRLTEGCQLSCLKFRTLWEHALLVAG